LVDTGRMILKSSDAVVWDMDSTWRSEDAPKKEGLTAAV